MMHYWTRRKKWNTALLYLLKGYQPPSETFLHTATPLFNVDIESLKLKKAFNISIYKKNICREALSPSEFLFICFFSQQCNAFKIILKVLPTKKQK